MKLAVATTKAISRLRTSIDKWGQVVIEDRTNGLHGASGMSEHLECPWPVSSAHGPLWRPRPPDLLRRREFVAWSSYLLYRMTGHLSTPGDGQQPPPPFAPPSPAPGGMHGMHRLSRGATGLSIPRRKRPRARQGTYHGQKNHPAVPHPIRPMAGDIPWRAGRWIRPWASTPSCGVRTTPVPGPGPVQPGSRRIRQAPDSTTNPITPPITKSGRFEPLAATRAPAAITPRLANTSLAEKIQLARIWTPPWR